MPIVTLFGVVAISFMMLMYALERRSRRFTLAFALGCLLSAVYGFASGAWPFGVGEVIWCVVALHRYRTSGAGADRAVGGFPGSTHVGAPKRKGEAVGMPELEKEKEPAGGAGRPTNHLLGGS